MAIYNSISEIGHNLIDPTKQRAHGKTRPPALGGKTRAQCGKDVLSKRGIDPDRFAGSPMATSPEIFSSMDLSPEPPSLTLSINPLFVGADRDRVIVDRAYTSMQHAVRQREHL